MRTRLTVGAVCVLVAMASLSACSPASEPPGSGGSVTTSPSVEATPSVAETPSAEASDTTSEPSATVDAAVPSADEAYQRTIAARPYRSWAKAPGFDTLRPGTGPHGAQIQVFVNEQVARTLAGPSVSEWPVGSKIVKDGFDKSGRQVVTAYMHKTSEGWFFAEWRENGDLIRSGLKVPACAACHARGTDSTRSFKLP